LLKNRHFTQNARNRGFERNGLISSVYIATNETGLFREVSDNLCPMSKASQVEQQNWKETKAAGKGRFVRRGMLGSFANGLVILLGLAWLDRSPSHSLKTDFMTSLIMLPLFLLGGYLTAHWQWQDLQKKYPEDRLPPWE
jgi:hypothetical protein